jgi:hypothetical protein
MLEGKSLYALNVNAAKKNAARHETPFAIYEPSTSEDEGVDRLE